MKQQTPVYKDGPDLSGVEIVFIQYRNDATAAEKLRAALLAQGINVPRIERLDGIRQSDVRFANEEVSEAADRLSKFVEAQLATELVQKIDLSGAGYKVPDGQFEVWLDM